MSSTLPKELFPISEEGRTPRMHLRHDNFNVLDEEPVTDPVHKIPRASLEIASSVIGSVVSHPCIVLRRQCQVNGGATRYHLTPFTLLPVTLKLYRRQGFVCLWKGCSGIFMLQGLAVGLETLISEWTPLPKDVSQNSSLKQILQHLLLKLVTFGILTPFYCSNFIETVQSDIASEKPGVFDFLREGALRLLGVGTSRARLLPLHSLLVPTALHRLAVHTTTSALQRLLHRRCKVKGSSSGYLDSLSVTLFSSFFANVLFFPVETILHRLYLQGTRTIIDDLDSGTAVLAVISTYEGVGDCVRAIISEEGRMGLYRGLGALLLQGALQAAVLRAVQAIAAEFEELTGRPRPGPAIHREQ